MAHATRRVGVEMKVIHVPFCFAPDPVGGTEVYVAGLARELQELGVDAVVAAPSDTSRVYTVDGLKVRRFATRSDVTDVSQLYGDGDILAATEFATVVNQEMPDVVHLHAFTPAVSLMLVRAVKSFGVPVVFTYHTSTVSCQRGTLLLWGKSVCDGRLDVSRCAGCTLNGLGMPRASAAIVGGLPPNIGHWLEVWGLQRGIWTALRMSDLVNRRHAAFRKMAHEVNHIVAVCNWVYDLLLLNGVPAPKVSISRQGVSSAPHQTTAPLIFSIEEESREMRVAFVGRLDATKGLHVLIDAFRIITTLNISLHVYGIVQSSANDEYRNKMLALSSGDRRITFHDPIPPSEVVARLRHYDLLAVPSQWMETGPMVVLEAFAAGIPVLGWNLGGISEIVRHRVDGLLIDPGPVTRWADTLRRLTKDTKLRTQLKAGVRPPRTGLDVAREMFALYNSILAGAGLLRAHEGAENR
jgi:glycosyltransferase involved in cell wall biosynthesis